MKTLKRALLAIALMTSIQSTAFAQCETIEAEISRLQQLYSDTWWNYGDVPVLEEISAKVERISEYWWNLGCDELFLN